MAIDKLMTDPVAAERYLQIDHRRPIDDLVDDYLIAKLAGNVSECTALEEVVREIAQVHFHRPGVNEALSRLCRYARMRKMGRRGSKDLKTIARRLRELYSEGDFAVEGDGRYRFEIGTLTIRCRPTPGAVELVARKYERGLR